MLKFGQDEMAKYPFLADAGQYLREQGFALEQFGSDPDLRSIVEKAFDRIRVAADGLVYKSDLDGAHAENPGALPREIFSFLLAVILLKMCNKHTLIRRFALAESRRAEKYLENDLRLSENPGIGVLLSPDKRLRRNLAVKVIIEISGVEISKPDEEHEGGGYTVAQDEWLVSVSDYLVRSVPFHEREWKLVNRKVEDGKVHLPSHQTVRLVRKELGEYITSRITSAKNPEIILGFEGFVDDLHEMSKKFETVTVYTGEYPPCIKHAIEVLEKGENLSHSGRFMLATFLLSRGQTVEQIAPLFKNAPDYNERVTLYQLNNLAGTTSGSKYSCPSCKKINTQGLCFVAPECDGIINPAQFGKRRIK